MSVYTDQTFVVSINNNSEILGPREVKEKEKWLTASANQEFNEYVTSNKTMNKALGVIKNGEIIGSLFYRLIDDKTIYLAQYFIVPQYQKLGIGLYVVDSILPKLHPEYKRYEVLTRHQNDAAILLYKKLGFLVGDISLVVKYEYDPLRYIGFYKNLNIE